MDYCGGAAMGKMKMLLQSLLCLVLVFSLTGVIYGGGTVAAGEETSLSPPAVRPLETVEIQLLLEAGWNMVSVPLVLEDNSSSAVFPGVAAIFAWNATSRCYYAPTEIEPDKGYWVAATENTTVTISGTPVHTWTSDIKSGWNMIGSVDEAVSIADPDDYRDGSVVPLAYWWDPVTRTYVYATDIEPGKGYWAAAMEDCLLTLATSYEIVCSEEAQVIPLEEVENIAGVSENKTEIIFEEVTSFVEGIEAGDILVCNQSVPGAEYGFLSRVTGVSEEGGVVRVQVEPATLEEVIEEGVIVVTQTIPMQELMTSALWTKGAEVMQFGARYDFSYSPTEGVIIEGYVAATADVDVYIKASFRHGIKEFWFIVSPGLETKANLRVETGVSWDERYTLAEIPGPRYRYGVP